MKNWASLLLLFFCFNLFGASPSFQQVTQIVDSVAFTNGTYTNGIYYGNGGGLTNLNAPNLVGVVPLTNLNTNNINDNVFVGFPSGNVDLGGGGQLVAVGNQALTNAYDLVWSTAVGFQSQQKNESGDAATSMGWGSLKNATQAQSDTAFGALSLYLLLTGNNDVAVGYYAGVNFTGAESYNIDIGNQGVTGDNYITRIGDVQTNAYIAGIIYGNGSGLTNIPPTALSVGATFNNVDIPTNTLGTHGHSGYFTNGVFVSTGTY